MFWVCVLQCCAFKCEAGSINNQTDTCVNLGVYQVSLVMYETGFVQQSHFAEPAAQQRCLL